MAKTPIDRVHELVSEIGEQNARIRHSSAKAAEALKSPKPDTFLGRKTQEPFPMADDEAERWAHSPGLQPPK
jgi:hypothetical protein